MAVAIRVENLSKAYQLGEIGTGTLSRDLERWFAKVRGKEDPFLKVGETNDRTSKGTSDIVWSLKDISFDIKQGDAVGIIGRNGAGKSTLLKLLSRITSPTTGSIKVKGRIASLLEVGTGFHPELTGKENIYLNGAILGMRKKEIVKKFDEIVEFAGIERYIDTPVKRYSSGMYVRLAFAVAAHLESEILIVDEVLAVGDAEFQKKCLGKMNDVSKGEGRTVLFVSHNMGSVTSLCSNGILLKYGSVEMSGNITEVVDQYIKTNSKKGSFQAPIKKAVQITDVVTYRGNAISDQFGIGDKIEIEIAGIAKELRSLTAGISVLDKNKNKIFTTHYKALPDREDYLNLTCNIPEHLLCPGVYSLDVAFFNLGNTVYDYISDVCQFSIVETGSSLSYDSNFGSVFVNCAWDDKS